MKPIDGTFQFQLCQKLRNTKTELNYFLNMFMAKNGLGLSKIRSDLDRCRRQLESQPFNPTLQNQERNLTSTLLEALRIEEEALRQKSRFPWLESGDRNTTFFHNSIKNRRNRKRIASLLTPNGLQSKNEEEAKSETIRYFKTMLGSPPDNHYPGMAALRCNIHKRISNKKYTLLDEIPDEAEIKEALSSIHSNKAPGPDGFNAFFFKETWTGTGPLVI